MIKTEPSQLNNNIDAEAAKLRNADKKNMEDFFSGKSPTFNFASLKRLVLSELSYGRAFKYGKICGFTRQQILNMLQYPERYGPHLVRLSQYMVLKSGYYKRLIEYFSNAGLVNWCVDTAAKNVDFLKVKDATLKSNYFKFVGQCNKFKMENKINEILKRMYVEDACFGFVTETEVNISVFFIDSRYCEIKALVDGNVYQYAINRSLLNSEYFNTLPLELQELLEKSYDEQLDNMVMIPYENSLCLKYHTEFPYLYPPFLPIINEILLIDQYKDLAKARTEADAYKLLYITLPTVDGRLSMGDELITPFIEMARQILPETFGVLPLPAKAELLESKTTSDTNIDNTDNAIENFYSEAGVSKAVISSASNGTELKYSVKVDSSDLYRIYRQIENYITFQMNLRGYVYRSYEFIYHILDMTIFDAADVSDREFKFMQASAPNKGKAMAAIGINPAKMIGNSVMEGKVLKDIFDLWFPPESAYVQSAKSSSGATGGSGSTNGGGAPAKDEEEISETTIVQRSNGSGTSGEQI